MSFVYVCGLDKHSCQVMINNQPPFHEDQNMSELFNMHYQLMANAMFAGLSLPPLLKLKEKKNSGGEKWRFERNICKETDLGVFFFSFLISTLGFRVAVDLKTSVRLSPRGGKPFFFLIWKKKRVVVVVGFRSLVFWSAVVLKKKRLKVGAVQRATIGDHTNRLCFCFFQRTYHWAKVPGLWGRECQP